MCTLYKFNGIFNVRSLNKMYKQLRRFSSMPSISLQANHESEQFLPPKKAKVVICGGGVMGAAVAYHLAQLGWGPQTVVLEQGRYSYLIFKLFTF